MRTGGIAFLSMTMLLGVMGATPVALAQTKAAPDPERERIAQIVQTELERQANATAAGQARELLRDPMSPVIGNPDGTVTLVEFFDYQCGFCKAAEPRLQQLVKDDPNVRLVLKEYPILSPESVVAAKAALASVKQGKYTAFHQAMLGHRGQLKTENIWEIAKTVGLDVERLRKDMDAPEITDHLLANFNLARKLKISVVPGFLVDTQVLSGVSPRTETGKIDFAKVVAEARARKGS
jgi:protein-disulfide isomerase